MYPTIETLDQRIESAPSATVTISEQLEMSRQEVAELRAFLESSTALSKTVAVDNLWPLIDNYADAREIYQRSTDRHLSNEQRHNVELARFDLAASISNLTQSSEGEQPDTGITPRTESKALERSLIEYASNPGFSHNDYADTMLAAAKSLASYRAIVRSKESQISHQNEELKIHRGAINTLASERAANAQLTQECEHLRAALEAKQGALGYNKLSEGGVP